MPKKSLVLLLVVVFLVLTITACGGGGPPDPSIAVPSGDPPFPPFTGSWVIDTTNTVSPQSVKDANSVLQKLRDEGIAEVVIVVIRGVKNTVIYPTNFGRAIKLGSAKTNNGVVYLVRPDGAEGEKIIYSIGTGLPRFTSQKVTEAIEKGALAAVNKGDYATGVVALARGTDEVLRSTYKPNPDAVTKDGKEDKKDEMTPEQRRTILITFLVIAGIWIAIGVIMLPFDAELALNWWLLGFRILLLFVTAGKVGGSTGGGGGFGGRSGSR